MDGFKNLIEIGKGSFATVYKATSKTGSLVAIKTVNRSKLNRKLLENLEMEIAILREARHRNVVFLYDVLVFFSNKKTEKEFHLIMEFCGLGDLSLYIKKRGAVASQPPLPGPWGGLDEFSIRYLLGQLGTFTLTQHLQWNFYVFRILFTEI
jgi:serine/threonine-protein kinase ULK2